MGQDFVKQISMSPDPPHYGEDFEDLFWIDDVIPAKFHVYNTKGKLSHFTVLYSGNVNEDIGVRNSFFRIFKESLKVNILCIDYPGFGLNTDNVFTEVNYFDCILKAYKWLVAVKNIAPKRIVLMGKGMGAGPIIHLAYRLSGGKRVLKGQKKDELEDHEDGFASLFLISPIESTNSLYSKITSSKYKSNYFFSSKDICKRIKSPTIICNIEDAFAKDSKRLKNRFGNLHKHLVLSDTTYPDEDDSFLDVCIELLDELAPIRRKDNLVLQRTPSIFMNPNVVLKKWLSTLGLESFFQQFLTYGIYNIDILKTVSRAELEEIGISKKIDQDNIFSKLEHGEPLVAPELIDYLIERDDVTIHHRLETGFGFISYLGEYNNTEVLVVKYDKPVIGTERFKKISKILCQIENPFVLNPLGVLMELDEMALVWPKHNITLSDHLKSSYIPLSYKIKFMQNICLGVRFFHNELNRPLTYDLRAHNIFIVNGIPKIGPTITIITRTAEREHYPPECRDQMFTKSGDILLLGQIIQEITNAQGDQNAGEQLITQIIKKCFSTSLTDRPSINEIIRFLKENTVTSKKYENRKSNSAKTRKRRSSFFGSKTIKRTSNQNS
eukprot:TRINITY_DN4186_c0_g1_i6.p1 TRINITY_DN4186_c0_g1~~TRINITY_DN4186_c0_g1_i6.p1  ORF type:complete len:610 (-),score=90.81 TRINITY_DN4186_c0_g1_i6:35-1864(-)